MKICSVNLDRESTFLTLDKFGRRLKVSDPGMYSSLIILGGQMCAAVEFQDRSFLPVLSCSVQSYPFLSYHILSYPALSCHVISCPVLPCPVIFCPCLSCTIPPPPPLPPLPSLPRPTPGERPEIPPRDSRSRRSDRSHLQRVKVTPGD